MPEISEDRLVAMVDDFIGAFATGKDETCRAIAAEVVRDGRPHQIARLAAQIELESPGVTACEFCDMIEAAEGKERVA